MKVIVARYLSGDVTPHAYVQGFVADGDTIVDEFSLILTSHDFDTESLRDIIVGEILDHTNDPGGLNLSLTEDDIVGNFLPSVHNGVSRTLTTSTGAAGFQVAALRDADVRYSVSVTTESTLLTPESGDIVLEAAPTNSATPGDWVEIARFGAGDVTAVLSSTVHKGQVCGYIPAGYYAKLRTISNSGTPVFAYATGQEMLV